MAGKIGACFCFFVKSEIYERGWESLIRFVAVDVGVGLFIILVACAANFAFNCSLLLNDFRLMRTTWIGVSFSERSINGKCGISML